MDVHRPPDKSVYWKIIFFVSDSKYMLWVLKKNVSMSRSISPIIFEIGIPNLVCGYILGWRSVAYHFRVTVNVKING